MLNIDIACHSSSSLTSCTYIQTVVVHYWMYTDHYGVYEPETANGTHMTETEILPIIILYSHNDNIHNTVYYLHTCLIIHTYVCTYILHTIVIIHYFNHNEN